MRSIYVSVAVALLFLVGVPAAGFDWYAGIAPGLLFGGILFVTLSWYWGRRMNAELMAFQANAAAAGQPQDEASARAYIDKMKAELIRIREVFAPWQVLVGPMLTGQIGMLECQRMEFDAALPLLEEGSTQDAPSRVMLACIYYRKGRYDDMDRAFGEAVAAQAKEPVPYALWAVLSVQQDRREQALDALGRGLAALPGHKLLTLLRDQVANKTRVSTEVLGEAWWHYFPEKLKELMESLQTRREPLDPAVVATLPGPIRAQYEAALKDAQRRGAFSAPTQPQRRYPAARS